MKRGDIDLVINVPRQYDERGRPDGAKIRRAAVDLEIPLITDFWLARRVTRAMTSYRRETLAVLPWSAYVGRGRA